MTKNNFSKNKVPSIKIKVSENALPNELMAFSLSIKSENMKSYFYKSVIFCELNILDSHDNLLINSSKKFNMRSGKVNIEFNYEPLTLKNLQHTFELSCDKPFYYDNAQIDQPNYVILGKD